MRRVAWVGLMAVMALVTVSAWAEDKPEIEAKDAAQAAAEAWLELVDTGKYEASWDQAAELFKGAVTKEQWLQACPGVRIPFGKLISRKVTSREYAEKVPGGPDGKYVIIQFESVFEKKQSAVETVTPKLDPNGKWRVSGYFIR